MPRKKRKPRATQLVVDPPRPPKKLGADGLCADLVARRLADPDDWHPDPPIAASVTRAALTCAICPVQHECFMFALARPTVRGVYGGHPFRLQGGKRASDTPAMSHVTPPRTRQSQSPSGV